MAAHARLGDQFGGQEAVLVNYLLKLRTDLPPVTADAIDKLIAQHNNKKKLQSQHKHTT